MLSLIRVILVRPSGETNVGSVARVLANMGLGELVLVAPRCNPLSETAQAYAVRAADRLRSARIVASIPEALDGCVRSIATTAKLGMYRRQAAIAIRDAAALAVAGARSGPVAIAFGPEDRGLLQEETLHFDRLASIPSDDAYPALNLSAAVTIAAYELRLAARAAEDQPPLPHALPGPPATESRKAAMYSHLFTGLDRIGFFAGPGGNSNPDHLKFALRHMLGRLDLTENEADILTGAGRQMQWFAEAANRRNNPSAAAE
ncbi:MAG: RNA methyltransferase [Phycisphaerales bacterium]|nr:RNA methyltransferase [Phycisphaerales bacterium]